MKAQLKHIFLLVIGSMLVQFAAYGQLKKSHYGTYKGTIAGFDLTISGQGLPVGATPIEIKITKDSIQIKIGNNQQSGVYTIEKEEKSYSILDCKINGQLAHERIIVYKKGRIISREGIKPQPDVELKKK